MSNYASLVPLVTPWLTNPYCVRVVERSMIIWGGATCLTLLVQRLRSQRRPCSRARRSAKGAPRRPSRAGFGWHYLSNATRLIQASFDVCPVCRVKDRHNLPKCSRLLKKTCVRQVSLDKWLPHESFQASTRRMNSPLSAATVALVSSACRSLSASCLRKQYLKKQKR